MKKYLIVFIIFVLMLSSCNRKEEESPGAKVKEGNSEYRLMAEIPVSKEFGESGHDTYLDWFYVFDDGLVAIHDFKNARIVEYRNNEFVRAVGEFDYHRGFSYFAGLYRTARVLKAQL